MEVVGDLLVEDPSLSLQLKTQLQCTTLNVSSYASKYEGEARHARLYFIASRCPNLQVEANRILLRSLKTSGNTLLYEEVAKRAGDFDKNWHDTTEQMMQQRLERAENDLSLAKNRMIKESTRMCHMEIGHIHMDRGNIQDALKSYFRSRDFSSTPQHNTEMCINVAIASIGLGQYRQAATYMSKIENLEDPSIRSKARAIAGLSALHEGQYRAAARNFLEVKASAAGNFASVLSAEDVAIYGVISALASFTRPDLRHLVLESKTFKPLLDLVPDFKALLNAFVVSNFGACLIHLDMLKPQLLLDIHMHKFAEDLCVQISDRILVQYFSPYLSVDLRRMAEAFGYDVNILEKSLAALIAKGRLPARIDSQAKTMYRRQTDDRHEAMAKVKHLSKLHTSELRRGILRLSLLQNSFAVSTKEAKSRAQFGAGGGGGGGRATDDDGVSGRGVGLEGMEVDPEVEHAMEGDHSDYSDTA